MNIKSIGVRTAVIAMAAVGSVVAATPSRAASLAGQTIDAVSIKGSSATVLGTNLGNPATANITGIDFNNGDIEATLGTGGFSSFIGGLGTIKDISFFNGVSSAIDDFITLSNPDDASDTLIFDLFSATSQVNNNIAGFVFNGEFSRNGQIIAGFGELSTQINLKGNGTDKPSSFSLTGEAVPTPALLPGLVGMGVAALRKRKSAEESAEA